MNRIDKLLTARRWGTLFLFLLNTGWLAAQEIIVYGRVVTPSGQGIEQVGIVVSGEVPGSPPYSLYSSTDNDGNYSVSVAAGSSFTVQPLKDDHLINGVTAFDVVQIRLHMLDSLLFNSPYKFIAADVNHSNTIDITDLTDLEEAILGIDSTFPNNTSWRFVRADYVFPDPQNPFQPPFPEVATFNTISANAHVDFIGVKIGDINQNALVQGSGNVGPGHFLGVIGSVHADQNDNCLGESNEPLLHDWLVTARGSAGTYHTLTNQQGQYFLYFPPDSDGNYDIFLSSPNALWSSCPDTVFNVPISEGMVATQNLNAQAVVDCPVMEVDLSAPFLRRCFENAYTVFYCNKGTIAAEDATVEVTFDPFLEVISSTVPWTSVNGQTYTFPVGTVASGDCGSFLVTVKLSCDATLGQTHCSTAHIFPDTLCAGIDSLWSGANLLVTGECQGGNIVFTVTNTGADMTEPVEYVVIEDIMIQMVGNSIQLAHGASETITVPSNGSTWRLEVEQSAYHPSNSLVSASVEGCGTNGQSSTSLGIIPLFSTNDAGAFEDEDCQVNIGAFDPNDKQGFPKGVGAQHFIPQREDIEYLIRFQNTGTDTAFHIIVLDTLSNTLDLNTLRVGGSSHPYEYHLVDEHLIQFVFQNILLPDSNINEAASHGYVKFTIAPKKDLLDGTVIENEAAIFFDFNLPVITNRTWHTLGNEFLNVSNVIFKPGLDLAVFPNPTNTTANFTLKTTQPTSGTLRLFDLRGRLVRRMDFDHNVFELPVGDLPAGPYYFRLDATNGTPLAAGKIIRAY